MQISRDQHDIEHQQKLPLRSLRLGLKDLTLVPYNHHPPQSSSPLAAHRTNAPSSAMIFDLLSPSSSPGLISGDYIGVESCVDVLKDDREEYHCDVKRRNCYNQKVQDKREEKRLAMVKRQELPPPIPMLARTENLPSHMPWVLKRNYTSDGRLVLTEERVRHHEYFKAHRSNGRLTLQLVPLDDEVMMAPPFSAANKMDNVEEEEEEVDDPDDDDENEDDDCYEDADVEEEEEDKHDDGVDELQFDDAGVQEETISTGKCFNFNSVGTGSPTIFGVPVPAIRQVHS